MIRALTSELLKIKGSKFLPLLSAAPIGLGALVGLAMLSAAKTPSWRAIFNDFTLPLWCLFLLPMSVVTFTALLAQIDHNSRAFEHLLSLPVPRWWVFLSKIIIACGAVFLMSFMMLILISSSATSTAWITGKNIPGSLEGITVLKTTSLIAASALPLTILQMWVGLRFKSFIIPMGFGIIGILITLAIALTGTGKADWAPHAQPFLILTKPDISLARAQISCFIALIIMLAAIANLSKREVS